MPSTSSFVRGYVVEAKRESEFPSSAEEGWLRHQENAAKPPLKAQTGWLVQATDYRKLNEPPRPRLQRNGTIYLMARPPLLCQGGDFAFPAGCPRRPCPADDLWVTLNLRQGGESFAQPRKMSKLQSRSLARARFISFFADHFRQHTTVMQSHLNRRVRLDCVYRTDHVSFGCEANSVAAFENSKRAERFQRMGNACESLVALF